MSATLTTRGNSKFSDHITGNNLNEGDNCRMTSFGFAFFYVVSSRY